VEAFDKDTEIASGLNSVFLPGHTPGHTGYRVGDGDDSLLIWGDVVHVAPVQMNDPSHGIAFDVDGARAEETRRMILDRAASENLRIAGMHLPFPAFGNVERDGSGYRFVPAPYAFEPV
jgi:glyoxylase-like metal-dependent hydrolase (beta-lactamase superfamily II)